MIDVEKEGERWVVTINRPEKANSLTADMLSALIDTVKAARGEAKVLVLTGSGKVFSAGADLDAAKAGLAVSPLWEELSNSLAALPCLTIAALNGTLAGGAFGMALACDLRLSVANAKFFYPVMKLGFLPQPSDPKRMAALIGPSRAKLILMGGQKVPAQEALGFGLVDRIVAAEDLLPVARDIAADTLAASPEIARGIKEMCA